MKTPYVNQKILIKHHFMAQGITTNMKLKLEEIFSESQKGMNLQSLPCILNQVSQSSETYI